MIAYVFVWWGKVCLFGGISGSKDGQKVAKPQDYKGSMSSLGVHQSGIKKIPTLPWILPSPLHDVTTVPSPLVLL